MTHEEISKLETKPYVFRIGDRGKGIEARYDKDTDVLIFPRIAFEYVVKMIQDALYEERNTPCSHCRFIDDDSGLCEVCPAMPPYKEEGAE